MGSEMCIRDSVRDKILNGKNWESLVPPSVAEYIKRIGGVERIRNLAKLDKVKV